MQAIQYFLIPSRLRGLESLTITSILFFATFFAKAQLAKEDTFEIEGYSFSMKTELVSKIKDGCGLYWNNVVVKSPSKKILFANNLCGEDNEDVTFIHRGYLTILEHYSSSVGIFQYYIFDLCKKRMIKTKKIDQGPGKFSWEKFIDLDEEFKRKHVEKVVPF